MIIDGMVSGLPTGSLIESLMRVERMQQTALKTRLSVIEKSAEAYRSINTKFDALRTAAEAMVKPATWGAVTATSSVASVSTTATSDAKPGSLTFSVQSAAATHSVVSATTWAATTDPSGYGTSLEVFNADGTSRGTVTIGGSGTLDDTVTALNGSGLGLSATAVQVSPGQYRLQVTSTESGGAAAFSLGTAGQFNVATQGTDAHLKVGTGPGAYDVYSSTNAFTGLMPGVTINVTKPETSVTVTVASDPAAVATSMQGLVDAANAALAEIAKHTGNKDGAKGALAGDYNVTRLTSQVLSAVANAVGGDGSPAQVGIQLTREGTITFDKTKFTDALAADPALAQRIISGTDGAGADGTAGTGDDTATVPGVAVRLRDLALAATDKTTGTLTLLAQGRDSLADNIQDRIDGWDVRLDKRRETLVRQFAAMETALGSMQAQSSWLAGQINSLPKLS
jgi:flagellar capping protein FliD